MSLRTRVIALVALVLAASMALGALVVGYRVRTDLAAELEAAMVGAKLAAAATFEDLPRSDHASRDLRQLVQTFDGNRHIRLALVAANGHVLLSSLPGDDGTSPEWFSRLIEERLPSSVLPVPSPQGHPLALLLLPTPAPDVHATWSEASALMKVVGAVALIGLVLVWIAINVGLRPLRRLGEQFAKLGGGDYQAHVIESGPPELRLLQRGFNDMTHRLGSTVRRNQQLGEQLARLQEEERAEIARDLHDEIGPRLFAINLDASVIIQLCEAHDAHGAIDRARDIQEAVAHVQGQVRDLLGWLRPARLTEFGLAAAIEDLVDFWVARRRDIVFDLVLLVDTIAEPVAEVVYRIVQEAVSNAVRHATASTVSIRIGVDPAGWLSVVVDNDGIDPAIAKTAARGFGLIGMRERVEAYGGTLDYGLDATGIGWSVSARMRHDASLSTDRSMEMLPQ